MISFSNEYFDDGKLGSKQVIKPFMLISWLVSLRKNEVGGKSLVVIHNLCLLMVVPFQPMPI